MAGVGMPAELYLDEFGLLCQAAFGAMAYQVGSSLGHKPQYRDVDVRVLLCAKAWEKLQLGKPGEEHNNPRWVAFTLAFTALGRQMTGLPIDFQLQEANYANQEFKGKSRSALGIIADKRRMLPEDGYCGEWLMPEGERSLTNLLGSEQDTPTRASDEYWKEQSKSKE